MGATVFCLLMLWKIYQFKSKDSEIKKNPLCLGNVSAEFLANMIKTDLNRNVYDFSVDNNKIDTSNIINIHKYLMKKHNIKRCLDLLRKCLL